MTAARKPKHAPPRRRPGASAADAPSRADLLIQVALRRWYDLIKSRLPEGASLVASVQKAARRGVLVSFRAKTENETFVAEARAKEPEKAVEEAGSCLFRRIEADFPDLTQLPLRDRLRRMFSDAG
jgi:hypothetical protein